MIFYTHCAGPPACESHLTSRGSRYSLIFIGVFCNVVDSKNVRLLFFHADCMWDLLCGHGGEKWELVSMFSKVF